MKRIPHIDFHKWLQLTWKLSHLFLLLFIVDIKAFRNYEIIFVPKICKFACRMPYTVPKLNASIYFVKEKCSDSMNQKSFAKGTVSHKHCNSIKVDHGKHCKWALEHLPNMNNQVLIRINGLSFVCNLILAKCLHLWEPNKNPTTDQIDSPFTLFSINTKLVSFLRP